jgi:hypothetical protein
MFYNRVTRDPETLLMTSSDHKDTFTTVSPTHYTMHLALADKVKNRHDTCSTKKLLITYLKPEELFMKRGAPAVAAPALSNPCRGLKPVLLRRCSL